LEVWLECCQKSRVMRVGYASPWEDAVAAVWGATV